MCAVPPTQGKFSYNVLAAWSPSHPDMTLNLYEKDRTVTCQWSDAVGLHCPMTLSFQLERSQMPHVTVERYQVSGPVASSTRQQSVCVAVSMYPVTKTDGVHEFVLLLDMWVCL